MKLSEGKAIILFRFHKEPEIARERLKILRHYDPGLPIYVLFGGSRAELEGAKSATQDLTENFWSFPLEKSVDWKWKHTDLMLKTWYRAVGKTIDFDFVYSYEYDLLTLKSLGEIYPDIDDHTLALAACVPFTSEIEDRWSWTTEGPHKSNYEKFRQYLERTYGITRQQKVCLGPGPLFPKKFLDIWSKTEDIDYAHDEIAYPAYAESLGFQTVDHGMHPGFGRHAAEKYFNCYFDKPVTLDLVKEQLALPNGRRTFHPVKTKITLDEVMAMMGSI